MAISSLVANINSKTMVLQTVFYTSPLGILRLRATATHVTEILFRDNTEPQDRVGANAVLTDCIAELVAYFAGDLRVFTAPLAPEGTPFQQQIWDELQRVTYGATSTYGSLANGINNPKSVRAVGAANGANPIAILIPCHRIIGANGNLTGYAGGLHRKEWLLAHEARSAPELALRLF